MTHQYTSDSWPVFQWPAPDELQRLAAMLPPPVPGQIIPIPLYLYPTYMALHKLVPDNVSPLGNLFVKRAGE